MAIKLSEIGRSQGEQANLPAKEPGVANVCGHAAEHMAKARMALDGESFDAGRALDHLDEAISCLQGLSRRGKAPKAKDGNTVVAFQPAKNRDSDRRSA